MEFYESKCRFTAYAGNRPLDGTVSRVMSRVVRTCTFVPLGKRRWIVVRAFGLGHHKPVPLLNEDRSGGIARGRIDRSVFRPGIRIRLMVVPSGMASYGDRHEKDQSFLSFLDR